ncbi:MAG TPA: alcohol dehydrogenase catalytic domain-containing protein, partial [Thermoleophilaceae bacterium]|nr:alcohol dehydrogenase catalytic domain-containing protein [Thermoleophilaceae bacterium]
MIAVTMAEPGRVELREVPNPELTESGMAVVRITRAGICGSDLMLLDGRVTIEPDFPIGHEYFGIV